jgi:hypothetical protein
MQPGRDSAIVLEIAALARSRLPRQDAQGIGVRRCHHVGVPERVPGRVRTLTGRGRRGRILFTTFPSLRGGKGVTP